MNFFIQPLTSTSIALENLPSEIQHLLQEIRHKESRSQGVSSLIFVAPCVILLNIIFLTYFWIPDIQQEIQKEASKYIRHTLRNVQAQSQNSSSLPSPVITKEKDAQLPAKIQSSYADIDKLAAEKLELAQRVVELITRARARLDHDLGKVLVLQGDTPELVIGMGGSHGGHGSFTLGGRNPVNQINESLRNAIAGSSGLGLGVGDVLPLSPLAHTDAHRYKSTPENPFLILYYRIKHV